MIIEADDDVLSIKINEKEWRDVFIMNDGAYIDVFVGSDNIDVYSPVGENMSIQTISWLI